MKNSGIEWIGEIPDSWIVEKLKFHATVNNEKKIGEQLPYIALENIEGFTGKLIDTENVYDVNEAIVAEKGDVLFGKLRPYLAKVYRVQNKSYVSSEFAVFRCNDVSSNFLKWYMLGYGFLDTVNASTCGTKMPRANIDFISNMPIPVISIEEQEKIAAHIDSQCSKIDKLIEVQQAQIDKLKEYKQSVITEAVTKGLDPTVPMKDSGVEWIGMIPCEWEIRRGKNVVDLLNKPVYNTDDVITCFRDGEVTLRKNRREEGFTFSDKEIGYQGIDVGDLVIHGMDGFAGAIGISDSRGKGSPVLIVLDSKQNKKFLMYYLRSLAYRDIFLALSTGIRVRSCDLRWNKISTLPFLIPSLEEQYGIVKYIEKRLYDIDKLIAIKQAKIDKLQEYKKSLIYEYVTGKKEVVQ